MIAKEVFKMKFILLVLVVLSLAACHAHSLHFRSNSYGHGYGSSYGHGYGGHYNRPHKAVSHQLHYFKHDSIHRR